MLAGNIGSSGLRALPLPAVVGPMNVDSPLIPGRQYRTRHHRRYQGKGQCINLQKFPYLTKH